MIYSLILAGGLGKRMNSSLPKVCHQFKGKPMISHSIHSCQQVPVEEVWVVMGKYRDIILEHIGEEKIVEINQSEALGTGHAVQCTMPYLEKLDDNDRLMVMPGDAPLIKVETLREMYSKHLDNRSSCTLLTCKVPNPFGFGRIIIKDQQIEEIVEEKDASDEIKEIDIVNGGFYLFRIGDLKKYLSQIDNKNAKGEYYLTDLIYIFRNNGLRVDAHVINDPNEISNVNTKAELERINCL